MDEEIIFKPIGYIKSPYEDVKNMPKSTRESGDVEAEMIINEEYLESMSSMEVGEEYMVLFYFHKSEGFKQRVPFMGNGPIKGLFSTHAPNRPFLLWEMVLLKDCFQLMLQTGQIRLGSLQ